MRVYIEKRVDGVANVVIVPGERAHLRPIIVRGVPARGTKEALRATIEDVSRAERGERPTQGP